MDEVSVQYYAIELVWIPVQTFEQMLEVFDYVTWFLCPSESIKGFVWDQGASVISEVHAKTHGLWCDMVRGLLD